MTTHKGDASTLHSSKTSTLSDSQEERNLKQRLIDEKAKESKNEKKSNENDFLGSKEVFTKLMSYDWTFLDFIIVVYFLFSAISYAKAFSSFMLMLPTSDGMFNIFLGTYWFACIYPTYKFFTNLNVRGAVLVHTYVNLISGGAILTIVSMTFWNSRYINKSYYTFYIILLCQSFIQFLSIIILSFFPFKVIKTRDIGRISAKYSMKFSEACVNSTIKTYQNATGYINSKLS
uniref:AMP-binding domain-containing protein n=1 Tax=Strongyloides stercoralis TaxID=6248 RepID=A0AAF5CUQ4_STRER